MEFPSLNDDGNIQWGLAPTHISFANSRQRQQSGCSELTPTQDVIFSGGSNSCSTISSCNSLKLGDQNFQNSVQSKSFHHVSNLSKPGESNVGGRSGTISDPENYFGVPIYVGCDDLLDKSAQSISLMRFSSGPGVDSSTWTSFRMGKEIKQKGKRGPTCASGPNENVFGGGTVFGGNKVSKEVQRNRKQTRKRLVKEVRKEDQPWMLKLSYLDKAGETQPVLKNKRFKGTKVGGISNNASYYIFMEKRENGKICYEAYPVDNWFDFKPIQCFKSLTATQAEKEFQKRNDTYNYFCVMAKKRKMINKNEEEDKENLTTLEKAVTELDGNSPESDEDEETEDDDNDDDKSNSTSLASRRKKKGKSESLAGILLDEEDEEQDVEFMSSSACSSSGESSDNEDGPLNDELDDNNFSLSSSESDSEN